jgi:3-methyl-2-oxobutanoate hydroxymethyltransferase
MGNNVLGYPSTIPVTMEETLVLTAAVARGASNPMIVGDLPFGSYQASPEEAMRNAARLVKVGANAIKLEGGRRSAEAVRRISDAGVPVMGHLGLTPQSLEEAGAFAVVLEVVPREIAREVTAALHVPTIGIGAGPHCDGQVLVITDLLGLTPDPTPRFVKRYADLRSTIAEAAQRFAKDVSEGHYPAPEHEYH